MSHPKPVILIVDDTPINIQILNEALQPNYQTCFALNGGEALEKVHALAPDLILLDIMMPIMDGFEVCRRLKADEALRNIPVIFITALGQAEEESEGLRLGAVDYITKPFNPALVRLRVRNHLELKSQRDELEQLGRELASRNQQLERLAHHDRLTGLPNRSLFTDRINRALAAARRQGTRIALLFIDLDQFKPINDERGHDVGDWLLQAVAKRMEACIRESDTVARMGGDEFAILLPEIHASADALKVAEKIRLALQEPFQTSDDHVLAISSSIGVALYPDHGDNERDLLRCSDEAMYWAKKGGRNRVEWFEPR